MPGVRLGGLLASTALALVISTAAGGAFAQSVTGPAVSQPSTAPAVSSPDIPPVPATKNEEHPVAAAGSPSPAPAAAPADATQSATQPPTTPPAAAASNTQTNPPTADTSGADKKAAAGTASQPAAGESTTAGGTTTGAGTSPAAAAGTPGTPATASSPTTPAAPPAPAAAAETTPPAPSTPTAPPAASAGGSESTGQASTPAAPPAPATAAAPSTPTGSVGTGGSATPAATAATPAAAPTIDQQIADQLHQLSTGKFDRILGGKAERVALEAFYSGRSYAPLWLTDGKENARAKATIAYLGRVDADGLDPADYPVPNFSSLTDPGALAEAELKFSKSVITYAHHAWIGRVAWSRVSADIEYDRKAPEAASVLAKLAEATDVADALDSYEPHAAEYVALKAKLAEIRAGKGDGTPTRIANGPMLKIGSKDPRVPALRQRLGLPDDGDTTYDKALAEAVKKFQREHQIKPTGMLNAATVEALNGPRPTHETDIILANMERWRWMPRDLGKAYVMINLPDFTASVYRDGKRIWKTKIVIGKPNMPTPIMTAMMKYITVNPIWHVPPSIINREYLPAMAQDPTVMQRMGLVVERDSSGKVIGIYQPPGDRNAEGRLRFNFPNKFLVYQHDTPDKYMFNYARRAFSHGCMRTQDPAKYAEVLLSIVRPHDGYTEERIKKMYGPNEINIEFPTFIPIHVTYQTAFVDDQGKLQFRDDIYGRDRQLLALLKGPERKVADIPVEHRISAAHREILQSGDHTPSYGGSGGPVGFFARLFGGFSEPPQGRPARRGAHRRVLRSRQSYNTR